MVGKDQKDAADKSSILASAKAIVQQLEDPASRAMDLILSYSIIPCLKIAVNMGVFKLLLEHKEMTAKDIAVNAKAEEEFVVRVMRVLGSLGVVDVRGPRLYALNALSSCFTIPSFEAGVSVCHNQVLRTASRLPEWTAHRGHRNPTDSFDGPYQFAFNTYETWFSWLSTRPREAADFNAFMTGFRESKPSWTTLFPAEHIIFGDLPPSHDPSVTVIDIGGGFGHDLHLLQQTCARTIGRLIVQEQPSVIATVPAPLRRSSAGGASGPIEFLPHDFFTPQPLAARTYLLKHILHDWPHAQAVRILRNLRAAMVPRYSTILILDLVLPDDERAAARVPFAAASLDIAMMAGFAGTERTERLWRELITEAGLTLRNVWVESDGDGCLEVGLDALEPPQGTLRKRKADGRGRGRGRAKTFDVGPSLVADLVAEDVD